MIDVMTSPTFIAIVDISVPARDRPAALSRLTREQSTVRSMPGCIGFRVFASPEVDTGLTVLHEWSDHEAFRSYLASDVFARWGDVLRAMVTAAPSSRRFSVELLETVA